MWGQKNHVEAPGSQVPCPEVGGGARLHHNAARCAQCPELLELRAGEPVPLRDASGLRRYREFEHILGQINSDRYRGHQMATSVRVGLDGLAITQDSISFGRSPSYRVKLSRRASYSRIH